MKISVVSFTEQGWRLAQKVEKILPEEEVELYQKPAQGIVGWAGEQFAERRALLFIGACGIAVRAIAPYVKDKLSDSPVVVMDEKGQYVIPILSGHVGGANELSERIAERIQGKAVLTTATDLNRKFAVDVFAVKNDLLILNREGIAKISSKVLRGMKITVSIEEESGVRLVGTEIPEAVEVIPYPPQANVDVIISGGEKQREMSQKALLYLKPKAYVLGIGCRKGKPKEEIAAFIQKNLKKTGLSISDIAVISSIERKRTEPGICRWAEENRVLFRTFSESELKAVKGTFHGSEFVRRTVGVENVCERAALKACGECGALILEKQAENGMTLAVAKRKWEIKW